jgi:hypothetical protein
MGRAAGKTRYCLQDGLKSIKRIPGGIYPKNNRQPFCMLFLEWFLMACSKSHI